MLNRKEYTEALRKLVDSRRRGREIDGEKVLHVLVACVPEPPPGERTFEEETFPTPPTQKVMDGMTTPEHEVLLECLDFLMNATKKTISKNLN